MKKLIGVAVILLALVLGSYYGMGYLTEKKVKENLTVVNQSNGVTAEIEEYKRGWFTSHAMLNWRLHVPEHIITSADGKSETVPAADYQMKMPLKIHHGPIIFADKTIKFGLGFAHTDLSLPPQVVEQFNNRFSGDSTQPKLDVNLFVSYLANTNVDMTVPAFKLVAKQGDGQFDWLGMNSATNISSDLGKVGGNLSIEGLRATKEQMKTILSGIISEYNLHKTNAGLYLGDASLSFTSLLVSNKDKKIFELNQFDVHSDTNIEDGLFSSHFKASIEKLVTNDKTYGPGNLEVAIRNLDAVVLARLNAEVNQAQQGAEPLRQQALLAMLPELPKLFNKGAEFEISELSFVVPEGKIEGNLLITLPKTEAANPFELMQKLQGSAKLKIPALVLKELLTESIRQKLLAPPQLPQAIQQSITQQMQKQEPAAEAANPSAPATSTTQVTTTETPAPNATVNLAEVAQQAAALADKQLATMVQSGLLIQQGTEYLIELNLNQGQIMVNGKPFNSEMLKFQ